MGLTTHIRLPAEGQAALAMTGTFLAGLALYIETSKTPFLSTALTFSGSISTGRATVRKISLKESLNTECFSSFPHSFSLSCL